MRTCDPSTATTRSATNRVIGAEADAAFRRSIEVLEEIRWPNWRADTVGLRPFRRGDNELQDRAMVKRALALFEEMNATGWIAEARRV